MQYLTYKRDLETEMNSITGDRLHIPTHNILDYEISHNITEDKENTLTENLLDNKLTKIHITSENLLDNDELAQMA